MGDPTGSTGPDPGKTTGTVQHRYVEIAGELHTTPDRSVEPWEWSATHATELDILHTCADKALRMTRLKSSI